MKIEIIKEELQKLEKLTLDEKVETINKIKKILHEYSPFRNEPVDCVLWVKNTEVTANDYNPNNITVNITIL